MIILFCFSDEIEYESSVDELDYVVEFASQEPAASRKQKPKKSLPPSKKVEGKKRRRIVMSSSDDEEERLLSESKMVEDEAPLAPSETPPAKNIGNSKSRPTCDELPNSTKHNSSEENSQKAGQVSVSVNEVSRNTSSSTDEKSLNSSKQQPADPATKGASILVQPAEVHRSQEVISTLRHGHKLNVCVKSGFEGAGYLISHRMAAIRITNSDFCHGSQRHKLVQSVQAMNDLFERPCLIIEMDKDAGRGQGPLESKGQIAHRTKLVDMTIAQLVQSNVRVVFSSNQKETADFLAAMLAKEVKRGSGLPRSLQIGPVEQEHYMPFYCSLPGVSVEK